jgi:redox-sensitive bicupin YhaK (pirin superfamily)
VVEGDGLFDSSLPATTHHEGEVVLYEKKGDTVVITTKNKPVRFLLISGQPLNEPIAWHGPIVMNTEDQIRTAFDEFQRGTFVKKSGVQV